MSEKAPAPQMSPEEFQTEAIRAAHSSIADVTDLAVKTGVPVTESLKTRSLDVKKHGVRQGYYNDETIEDMRGPEYRPVAVETEDAIVINTSGVATAQTKERTGKYTTSRLRNSDHYGHPQVQVERPDGKGGIYTGNIRGAQGKKAVAIVADRAAKRTKKAVVNRAISIADELKQEQDK